MGAVLAWPLSNGDTAYTVVERMEWPVGALREVGYRPPKDVDQVYGVIFKTWDELPDEIERPDPSP